MAMVQRSLVGIHTCNIRSWVEPTGQTRSRELNVKHLEHLSKSILGKFCPTKPIIGYANLSSIQYMNEKGESTVPDIDYMNAPDPIQLVIKNKDIIRWSTIGGNHRVTCSQQLHVKHPERMDFLLWPSILLVYNPRTMVNIDINDFEAALFTFAGQDNVLNSSALLLNPVQIAPIMRKEQMDHFNKYGKWPKGVDLQKRYKSAYGDQAGSHLNTMISLTKLPTKSWNLLNCIFVGDVNKAGGNVDFKAPKSLTKFISIQGLNDVDRFKILMAVVNQGLTLDQMEIWAKRCKLTYCIREEAFNAGRIALVTLGQIDMNNMDEFLKRFPQFNGDAFMEQWRSAFSKLKVGKKAGRKRKSNDDDDDDVADTVKPGSNYPVPDGFKNAVKQIITKELQKNVSLVMKLY